MSYDKRIVKLAEPFADRYIHTNPSGGGQYVAHHVVEQRLIATLGMPPDFKLVEVIRGDIPAVAPNPQGGSKRAKAGSPALSNAIVGVVCRMSLYVSTDPWQKVIEVEEAGDCEDPHNWPHDGARLKDAMSDAYKRCAMRAGCGLHLWSQGDYFLHRLMTTAEVMDVGVPLSSDEAEEAATDEPVPPASAPTPEVEHLLREDPGLLPPNQFAELEVAHLGRAHVPRAEVADLLTKNTAKPVPPASAPTHTGLVEQRKLNPLGSNTKALARAGEQHQRVVTLYGGQKKSLEAAWKMFGISAKDLPVISMLSTEQAEQMIRAKGGL